MLSICAGGNARDIERFADLLYATAVNRKEAGRPYKLVKATLCIALCKK